MELINETPFKAAWVTSKLDPPRWWMTCIVKGTFLLQHEGIARRADEQLDLTGDIYVDGNHDGLLRYADDFVYIKPRTDLLLVGRCYAPGGIPSRQVIVKLRIGPFEKALLVTGNRKWMPLGGPTQAEPFLEMPITYERAYGGLGYARNPLGKGFVPADDQERTAVFELPNIEAFGRLMTDPRIPAEPAGLGPISQMWEQRLRKIGTFDEQWQSSRWPWYPEDFDTGFFNAASEDQQTPYLKGDEEIYLENLHREHPRFNCRLPGVQPRCFVRELSNGFLLRDIPLALDTVWLDMDAQQLVLLWRGTTPVRSNELFEFSHLLVATEPVSATAKIPEAYSAVLAQALIRREEEEAEDFDLEDPDEELEEEEEKDEEGLEDEEEKELDPEKEEEKPLVHPVPAAVAAPPPLEPTSEDLRRETLSTLQQASQRLEQMGQNIPEAWAAAIASPPSISEEAIEEDEEEIESEEIPGSNFDVITRDQVLDKIARKQSLSEHDLTGMDLSGQDLSGVDLRESILQGAVLIGTILNGADLTGAYLASADLRQVEAKRAIFSEADLTAALLVEADLSEADLSEADLSQADLRHANLSSARADGLALPNANLSYANLGQARLVGADLAGCQLHGSNLSHADFTGAILEGAWGRNLHARDAVFHKTAVARASFIEADFANLRADESVWEEAQLYGCSFKAAGLNKAEFSGAYLRGANFSGATLREAVFDRAHLREATAVRANLLEASLVEANVEHANFRESNLFGANLRDTRLQPAHLEGANLRMTVRTTEAE